MPTCLQNHWLMSGVPDTVLASLIVESWPEALEILSKPGSIAILLAGVFGLGVGLLLRGRGKTPPAPAGGSFSSGYPELQWRHEKLVLAERQQAEKHGRLEAFASSLSADLPATDLLLRWRLFLLAEGFREARQKVGSDLSRMIVVRDRLGEISGLDDRAEGTVKASRIMAGAQALLLDSAREQLRQLTEEALRIEADLGNGKADPAVTGDQLRRALMGLKGRVLELPQGCLTSTEALDQQLRELLAPVKSEEIEAVRNILLIDGSLTSSLNEAGGIDLPASISRMIEVIELAENAESPVDPEPDSIEQAAVALAGGNFSDFSEVPFFEGGSVGEVTEERVTEDLTPDSEFRTPAEFEKAQVPHGRGFRDLTREDSLPLRTTDLESDSPPGDDGRSLILFCSNNVELWGKDVYRGAHCRARPVNEFPSWAQWISIQRLDTGERVFAPVKTASLFNGQTSDPVGFNGTNELFYGARHLGIFSDKCPNEVETRFTYGGWGFGHRAHESAPDVEQLQAAGWEGREIPADTVFEIVIHEELPKLGSRDRTLEQAG